MACVLQRQYLVLLYGIGIAEWQQAVTQLRVLQGNLLRLRAEHPGEARSGGGGLGAEVLLAWGERSVFQPADVQLAGRSLVVSTGIPAIEGRMRGVVQRSRLAHF